MSASTSARQKQLRQALAAFYRHPVAGVSLELGLTIGLTVILGLFFIRPSLVTMTELNQKIEDREKLIVQLKKKFTALQTAQARLEEIEPELVVLDQAIPTNGDIMRDLKLLEKIVSEHSVVITSAGIQGIPKYHSEEELENQDIAEMVRLTIPISLTLQGDYQSIRQFIEAIQESRRVIQVDTISFSIRESRGEDLLTATTTLTFPYLGEE